MATALKEFNFEILANATAASGVVFGIGQPISVDQEGFDPGEDDWNDEDQENPRRGGRVFGRETLRAPTWTFDMFINRRNPTEALASLESIKSHWRSVYIRDTPGAVAAIRYRVGGRTRRVYGRPRRFAAPPTNRILNGYVPIVATFECVDGFTYDDVEQITTMRLSPPAVDKGFVFPRTFPVFVATPNAVNTTSVQVGGSVPAYPVITFNGPMLNPTLKHGSWTLSLTHNIPAGGSVTFDLRPWAMTIKDHQGRSVAGSLNRSQRLSDMKLYPGTNTFTLSAYSTSSSPTCTVRWANTWNSI